MIVFDLQCANAHCFEGWFEDREAFEAQLSDNALCCPICGDTAISRLPSVFAIKGTPGKRTDGASSPDPGEMLQKLSEFVHDNFDNVGADFAKEALKIHYGAAEARNIRGVSTPVEEQMLHDEGVAFLKFPLPSRTASKS